MGVPKSVIKVNKNGVEFTSNVDAANYYLYELTRAAFRDVAKFIKKRYQEQYYALYTKHTGKGKKAISAKVHSRASTRYPRLEIGIKHSTPGNPVQGFYTYFHEVGTNKEPKKPLLYDTVYQNISTIVEIESKYLSAIDSGDVDSLLPEEDEIDLGEEDV